MIPPFNGLQAEKYKETANKTAGEKTGFSLIFTGFYYSIGNGCCKYREIAIYYGRNPTVKRDIYRTREKEETT